MSVVAEFRLTHPAFGLAAALEHAPEMRLDAEQVVADDPREPTVFFWASGDDFAAFEAGMDADPTARTWERVDDTDGRRLYRLDVDPDNAVVIYPTDVELGVSRLHLGETVEGLEVHTRFPDRGTLAEYVERLRDRGIDVTLRRLYRSGAETESFPSVSPKQRAALVRAAEMGYFGVPREAGLDRVADSLGVSRQSTSERIRRGTDAMIREAFDVEE